MIKKYLFLLIIYFLLFEGCTCKKELKIGSTIPNRETIISSVGLKKALSVKENKLVINDIVLYRNTTNISTCNFEYTILITLKNIGTDSISFWVKSCGLNDNFIFNPDSICFIDNCISSAPIVKTIIPQDTISFKGLLCTPKEIVGKSINVGFLLYKETNHSLDNVGFELFYRVNFDDIIWYKNESCPHGYSE